VSFILVVYGKVPSKSSSRRIIINRRTGRPMVISSKKTLMYEKDFAKQVTSQYKNKFNPDDRLKVSINWYSNNFKQDIDNIPKVILDNCEKNDIIYNDNRVDFLQITRIIDKKNPRADIFIEVKNRIKDEYVD